MTICMKIGFASRAAALALLLCAVGCDRAKTPASATKKACPRASDPVYRAQLQKARDAQKAAALDIKDLEARIALERRRARAALPAGATEQEVLAELEKNPVKYPKWPYLMARLRAARETMTDRQAQARAAVAARLNQEVQHSRNAAGQKASAQ